mgnify:CR=1 FL=1
MFSLKGNEGAFFVLAILAIMAALVVHMLITC